MQNINIDLNHDGTNVIITYDWARSWYNVGELFRKHLAAKEFTMHHPKVLTVNSALEKCRKRIDVAPESTIAIKLPIKSKLLQRRGVKVVFPVVMACRL